MRLHALRRWQRHAVDRRASGEFRAAAAHSAEADWHLNSLDAMLRHSSHARARLPAVLSAWARPGADMPAARRALPAALRRWRERCGAAAAVRATMRAAVAAWASESCARR